MYGNFLQQSTKKLQDDLRQTMKTYSTEKQQLLRHLASLRHEMDELRLSGSESPISTDSTTDLSTSRCSTNRSKSNRFYHAPNIAAHKLKKSRKKMSKQSKRNSESSEDKKSIEGILKLPIIKEGTFGNPPPTLTWTNKNSEWDSAHQISLTNLPPLNPVQEIVAAKELLEDDYVMPKIDDPDRTDKGIPKKKSQEKKRVKFSSENQVAVITGENTNIKTQDSDSESDSKNLQGSSQENKTQVKGVNQRQHYLPPLELGSRRRLNPKETEDHKMLYISIRDPDARRKTLSEILHAVRLRMQENEHHLRFGEMPRRNRHNSYETVLNSSQESLLSTDSTKSKSSHFGAPKNTAYRMGRRSSNAQLQSYLRKMSKSRRMIEHMEVEEYRLAHIMGHKELMAVSQQENNSVTT